MGISDDVSLPMPERPKEASERSVCRLLINDLWRMLVRGVWMTVTMQLHDDGDAADDDHHDDDGCLLLL